MPPRANKSSAENINHKEELRKLADAIDNSVLQMGDSKILGGKKSKGKKKSGKKRSGSKDRSVRSKSGSTKKK